MSTEKWKSIPGFPRHKVSDKGRVMVTKSNGNTKILAIEPKYKTAELVRHDGSHTRIKVLALIAMAFDDDDTFESPRRVYVEPEYDVIPDHISPKGRGYWTEG
jgi:hypothetical protein